jgi:hypothetical protein
MTLSTHRTPRGHRRSAAANVSIVAAVGLFATRGESAPPSSAPPIAFSGPCVDPIADARHRERDPSRGAVVRRAIDFDGDGVRDYAVAPVGTCGSGGCDWHLYVARGRCGHWVGWLRGREIAAERTVTHGFRVVHTEEWGGTSSWTERRAEFDGTSYHSVERDCVGSPARCRSWRAP